MKHAYLILAHNEQGLLKTLVSLIDDPRNDIFIHWDLKAGERPGVEALQSGLFWIENRVDVRWADFTMVEAEYALFEAAYAHGPYEYYHLISGVDLPVRSQDYIHSYCAAHPGAEYIGFAHPSEKEIRWRTQHRFIFTKALRHGPKWKSALRKAYCLAQDVVGYKRHDVEMKKGPQWVSVTNAFMSYLIEKKNWAYKTFKRTFCPDEMFIPTLCWNSAFRDKVASTDDEFGGCRRYIKWVNGDLLPLETCDVEKFGAGDYWFARKFSGTDKGLIESVKQMVKNA